MRWKRSFIKRKIRYGKRLFDVIARQPNSSKRRAFLKLIGYELLQPCDLAGAAVNSFDLVPPSDATIAQPNFAGGAAAAPLLHTHPKLQAHVLRSAIVSAYTSGIVCGDRLALPDDVREGQHRVMTDNDNLFHFEPGHSVRYKYPCTKLKNAIFIGGSGAYNWYHFVIEILPKALLAQMLPAAYADYPLVVPEECRSIPSFAEVLAIFAGGRETTYLPKGKYLQVEELIAFDEVSTGPDNVKVGFWPEVGDYSQHDDFMRTYVDALRAALLPDHHAQANNAKRIFLIRPGVRRNYNQDALVEIATKYGFEPHDPSGLSLAAQAQLFASAEMIVGPSGAAWVGMAFRQDPAQFLSWLPAEYQQFCSYASLAAILGHEMRFLETIPDRPLKWSGDAYTGGYQLAPEPFERALQHMTGVA